MARPITRSMRDERRKAAQARVAKRQGRSDVEQLALIKARPGGSTREMCKLQAKVLHLADDCIDVEYCACSWRRTRS